MPPPCHWWTTTSERKKRIVVSSVTYNQAFDVENRLISVSIPGNTTTTSFAYDAAGQRTKTTVETVNDRKTVSYYPFPNYEEELVYDAQYGCNPKCGYVWVLTDTIKRSTYHLAGQPIATRITGDPEEGNNGLFYFLVDHLGSTTLLVTTLGAVVSGTAAYYLPYGNYRSTPPSGELTDKGFTGHAQQDNVGLIYMRARFYVPLIGRFASADTIVPGPTNPQAFNRYTYVLGNPLRLVDPSGHGMCDPDGEPDATCLNEPPQPSTPPPPPPAIPNGPMVTYSVDAKCACSWSEAEMASIYVSVYLVGIRLAETLNAAHPGWNLTPEEAFLLVYGGSVDFHKMGGADPGYWGETFLREGRHVIEIYGSPNFAESPRWAVHELGHAFVNAVAGGATAIMRPVTWLDIYQKMFPSFPNRPLTDDPNYLDDSPWGFAGGQGEWQFSKYGKPPEEFADMFVGWVFNTWAPDPAGQMRASFMDSYMPMWVNMDH